MPEKTESKTQETADPSHCEQCVVSMPFEELRRIKEHLELGKEYILEVEVDHLNRLGTSTRKNRIAAEQILKDRESMNERIGYLNQFFF